MEINVHQKAVVDVKFKEEIVFLISTILLDFD